MGHYLWLFLFDAPFPCLATILSQVRASLRKHWRRCKYLFDATWFKPDSNTAKSLRFIWFKQPEQVFQTTHFSFEMWSPCSSRYWRWPSDASFLGSPAVMLGFECDGERLPFFSVSAKN